MEAEEPTGGMSARMTFLFAVAGACAVGNLYWAQPLLAEVARTLSVPVASTGTLITATQMGYAAGVLFLVPLGDVLSRRRLIPVMMGLSALALFSSASAANYLVLLVSLVAVGVTTVSGQLLVPLAGDLARHDQRGRVIGSVTSGILIGIMASRTVSGLVAATFGWRAIYYLAAAMSAIMATCLALALPAEKARPRIAYHDLLLSIAGTVRAHRAVQVTLVLGACGFCVFTMFWTSLTFLLSSPPFSYSVTKIGLVGLVGLAGAVAARHAGKLHDRGWSSRGTGAALVLALVSLAIAAAGRTSIALILLAVLLIDMAVQATNVLHQTRLFTAVPEARSRANTAFVFCNFTGGAIGSIVASALWASGGWYLLTAGEGVVIALALIVWATNRRTLQRI